MFPVRDRQLVQIVDHALADATLRARKLDGDSWLACRPGCTPCCHGVFRISALDAMRLRTAFHELEQRDSLRAAAIAQRRDRLVRELSRHFPGNAESGVLDSEEEATWDDFADLPVADAACPVLDPATGRCDLYESRPLTCRVFGPPVKQDEGLGVCELCYVGATQNELLAGEMQVNHISLEEELNAQMPATETIIAWALLPQVDDEQPQTAAGS